MSAIELAMEKVRQMDESHAQKLLAWLQTQQQSTPAPSAPWRAEKPDDPARYGDLQKQVFVNIVA